MSADDMAKLNAQLLAAQAQLIDALGVAKDLALPEAAKVEAEVRDKWRLIPVDVPMPKVSSPWHTLIEICDAATTAAVKTP